MSTTRSLADTYVSIPELMRLARGTYRGRVVDEQLERKVSAADLAGMRRGLLALAKIKQSLPE